MPCVDVNINSNINPKIPKETPGSSPVLNLLRQESQKRDLRRAHVWESDGKPQKVTSQAKKDKQKQKKSFPNFSNNQTATHSEPLPQ